MYQIQKWLLVARQNFLLLRYSNKFHLSVKPFNACMTQHTTVLAYHYMDT